MVLGAAVVVGNEAAGAGAGAGLDDENTRYRTRRSVDRTRMGCFMGPWACSRWA